MQRLILLNWLIIAIAALLVGVYVSIFESFIEGKAYVFFIVAILSGVLFYFKQKKGIR